MWMDARTEGVNPFLRKANFKELEWSTLKYVCIAIGTFSKRKIWEIGKARLFRKKKCTKTGI
jgi:hypothetical protein